MSLLTTTQEAGLARIHLHTGRGNPLSPDALEALEEALTALHAAPPQALLLDASGSSVFSGGFALPVIGSYDRAALDPFLKGFLRCLDLILTMGCPSVTSVGGHAVAAGFILSLATDLRVVKRGKLKLGLPEVDLGVPLPAGAQALFAARTSLQHALRYSTTGQLFGAEEAHRIGYADDLDEDPDTRAATLARDLAAKPGRGASMNRRFMGEAIAERVRAASDRWHDAFLDAWMSPEAQTAIQAQAARLTR